MMNTHNFLQYRPKYLYYEWGGDNQENTEFSGQ